MLESIFFILKGIRQVLFLWHCVWTQGLHLEPHQGFFLVKIRVSELFAGAGFEPW
jgi:hypothetical protein